MAKKISQEEFDAIVEVINQFPDGISLGKIKEALPLSISHRNLHHRLEVLVKDGRLISKGNARGRLYFPAVANDKKEVKPSEQIKQDSDLPISSASEETLLLVRRSIQLRKPVGYNQDFLDDYRPNETYYLPVALRQKLLDLGRTDGERPAGTYAREIFNRLLIDLSWNSSRLEGNTYSLLETERLLNLSKQAEGKDVKEARMILNHKDAIEFLVNSSSDIDITPYTILNLHSLLSNDLLGDLEACGRLRFRPVGIGKSVYQPLSIPQRIVDAFQQILNTAYAIKDSFEQAFFLMVHLPYLQPFDDVNKRVSRLAANIPLIKHNLCPLSFVDVPEFHYISGLLGVYELNRIDLYRDVFAWAYERSCLRYSVARRELGNPDPFRLTYRLQITEIVSKIIRGCMNKVQAVAALKDYAYHNIPAADHLRFIEAVEKDLMSLHEGNMARHRILPKEFAKWRESWA